MCAFCLSDDKSTKEHLLSRPICDALGVDRRTLVASLDGRNGQLGAASTLDTRAVRLPCATCNSGWMSELEGDTARTLRRWMSRPDQRLTAAGVRHLTRWLVKTAIVFGFAETDARRFMDNPTETSIPDVTTARALAAGETPPDVTIGAARVAASRYIWGAGNPTVEPTGPDRITCRAINVVALNLGALQLWVVMPVVARPDELRLPRGVTRVHPQLRYRSLRGRHADVDPTQVAARYSDGTTEAVFAALERAQQITRCPAA